MPRRGLACGAVVLFAVVSATTSLAQTKDPAVTQYEEFDEWGEPTLRAGTHVEARPYLDQTIISAAKKPQRVEEAPAIVTVISAEEIRRAGYRSVAEALEMVPGLAITTDHVFYNIGVRGISGGLRGGSRHIKLLIDGEPVGFRPDASNFLGPELMPLETIERIEVIRGPASALYGRDAFLGVVNLIPKKAEPGAGEVALRTDVGTRGSGVSVGGEALVLRRFRDLSVTLGAFVGREDRSGLTLPSSSVNAVDYAGNSTSQGDTTFPFSVYGLLGYELGRAGVLRLQGGLQNLDAMGEFLDYGPLSHRTRINLRNGYARLAHSFRVGRFGGTSFVEYSGAGDGPNNLIQPMINGQPTSRLVRWRLGQNAVDVGAEGSLDLFSRSSALLGLEYSYDLESIRQNIFISPALEGMELDGPSFGDRTFSDVAPYAQLLFGEIPHLQLAGNLRYDYHNVFGGNVNYRAVAVVSAARAFTVKAVSSSSYRAPTPEQLYGTPVRPGDAIGSLAGNTPQQLQPQTALSQEISLGYAGEGFRVDLDGYYNEVKDRIQYILVDGNLQPSNRARSQTLGLELAARGYVRLFKRLNLYGNASFSYQGTRIRVPDDQATLLTPRERSILELGDSFPDWMLKWSIDAELPRWHLNLHLRMSILGPRMESPLNQEIGRPFPESPLRGLGVSAPLDVVLSTVDLRLWGARETRLELIALDLAGSAGADPGFGGINVPPLGRRVLLSLRQAL